MRVNRSLLLLLALCWFAPPLAAQTLQPFQSGSYQAIVDARSGRPFVLAFWSIDCPPCYKELKMFGELLRSQPLDLVLVSTDGPGAATQVAEVLARFGLAQAETWLFAAPPERLRFEIDRTWYGELPRSYLFAGGQREAISGLLEPATLEAWRQRQH